MVVVSDLFNKYGSIFDDSFYVKFEKYIVEIWICMNNNMFIFMKFM